MKVMSKRDLRFVVGGGTRNPVLRVVRTGEAISLVFKDSTGNGPGGGVGTLPIRKH